MVDRRRLYALHGAIARALGAALIVTLATGTIATISIDLERLLEPRGAEQLDDGALDVLEAWARGGGHSLRVVELEGEHGAMAWVVAHDGRWRRVFLDASGRPFASRPLLGASAVLRDVHRQLFVGHAGLYVVTPLSLVLLVMIATGLASQRRFALGMTGTSAHARTASLHRTIGTLSLAPALLFGVTGAVYVAETIVEDAGGSLEITPPRQAPHQPESEPRSLESLVDRARDAAPWLGPHRVALPRSADGALLVFGAGTSPGVREVASFVAIDPTTTEILASHDAGLGAPLDLAADLTDPLHFGSIGGRPTRWLWFVFGLLVTALATTGLATGRVRLHHETERALERRVTLIVGLAWLGAMITGLVTRSADLAPSGQLAIVIVLALGLVAIVLASRTGQRAQA